MYIIDLFYTGDLFLFENYGAYVGKMVYFMYLDKERERAKIMPAGYGHIVYVNSCVSACRSTREYTLCKMEQIIVQHIIL